MEELGYLGVMTNVSQLAARIDRAVPTIKAGSLRVYGDFFGRPFDNIHQVASARASRTDDSLIVEFVGGETLTVWDPKEATVSWSKFSIEVARKVRWEWFFYGRPHTPENRFFIEHSRIGDDVTASTDVDWYAPTFNPSVTWPAFEILDGWDGMTNGDERRPRPRKVQRAGWRTGRWTGNIGT